MTKLLIFVLLFLPSLAFSLEISGVQKQQDGDYKIIFCKLFKIENIALVKKSFGSVLQMPREVSGYKNLAITSKELDSKIKNTIEGIAKVNTKTICQKPILKIVSARKIKESSSVLCQVSFDNSLDIIVFASKYKKGKKDIYRVSFPQDLKFLDKNYKAEVRTFILKNTKELIDNKI
ncbi:MAG: hypothetical protein IKP23_05505 [Elusimicrobiaceae bacterium]|nr:hypothetical protein [Elusimicrobiaceae bacterium]